MSEFIESLMEMKLSNVFIGIFIVFIILGVVAVIHSAITAPTLDEDTGRFIHWKKAKAYFKKKHEKDQQEAKANEEQIVQQLKKVYPRNKDGTFKKYKE